MALVSQTSTNFTSKNINYKAIFETLLSNYLGYKNFNIQENSQVKEKKKRKQYYSRWITFEEKAPYCTSVTSSACHILTHNYTEFFGDYKCNTVKFCEVVVLINYIKERPLTG